MNISTRTQGDVTLIAFDGNLDTNTSPAAQEALDDILQAGGKKLAIDFSALDYVSSAGLRVLLATAKRLAGSGGVLHLFGLNETVEEVFEMSGFNTIFKVFPDEAAALGGL